MDIRPSPIAGTWYPGTAGQLAKSIDHLLEGETKTEPNSTLLGVIVPHAGHRYSGSVAGAAFRLMRGLAPDIVAVVSPMHNLAPGQVLTSGHDAYQTPLGEITVDQEAVRKLSDAMQKRTGFALYPLRNDREHSLEIELPFLQRALGPFHLLPVMVLDQRESTAEALGLALGETLAGRKALLVASSDLSHFFPDAAARTAFRGRLDHIHHTPPPR